jgi:hypothetical protein
VTSHLSKRALKRAASERSAEARRSKFTSIVLAQSGLCWFCGEEMGSDCTREHLLAQSLGGGNERSNLRAAHSECNSAAGSLSVSDKLRLRAVGHSDGRQEMLHFARQLRRADARMAFSDGANAQAGTGKRGGMRTAMRRYVESQRRAVRDMDDKS